MHKKTVIIFSSILVLSHLIKFNNQTISGQSVCPLQSVGDIDCSGKIDLADFEIWRKGYLGIPTTITPALTGSPTPISTPTISTTTGTPSPTTGQLITPPPGDQPTSEQIIGFSTLPQVVQTAVNQKYPNNTVIEAKELRYSNGAIEYEVQVDDAQGNIWDIFILPDGTVTLSQPG